MTISRSGSYPRAILHIDGDSFFASCEVAKDPSLKGKPVIIGKERGIASALTYEAKALGVKRGMNLAQVLRICPQAVILPSDHRTYSLYAHRMYSIVRSHVSRVEEYSIDECFADLSGFAETQNISYEKLAFNLKTELYQKLGLTFSLGLAPTKVLAKVASNWQKPNGLTFIPVPEIKYFLAKLPVEKIWGIGSKTANLLNKYGIYTARDLCSRDEVWVRSNLAKPYQEIWFELQGKMVLTLNSKSQKNLYSISATKTFTQPSGDRFFVLSQLSRNIENACTKARHQNLQTQEVFFFLKTSDFDLIGQKIILKQAVSIPQPIFEAVENVFDVVYKPGIFYRATGIILRKLQPEQAFQPDLFSQSSGLEIKRDLFGQIDALEKKYGRETIFLGSSFLANKSRLNNDTQFAQKNRDQLLPEGKNRKSRFRIPFLGEVG